MLADYVYSCIVEPAVQQTAPELERTFMDRWFFRGSMWFVVFGAIRSDVRRDGQGLTAYPWPVTEASTVRLGEAELRRAEFHGLGD